MVRGFYVEEGTSSSVNSDLMFGLTNQALILVCKFLEVWDSTSALAKSDPRIVDTRRAVQPICPISALVRRSPSRERRPSRR